MKIIKKSEYRWMTVKAKDLKTGEIVKTAWGDWVVRYPCGGLVKIADPNCSNDIVFAFLGFDSVVEVWREVLELPTEPLSVFWGEVSYEDTSYIGVIIRDLYTDTYLTRQRFRGGYAHPSKNVTRLPWPPGVREQCIKDIVVE